ncbi:MAG: hypothetical protein HYV20_11835 [Gemmatimonadetes bacterium]|nr:hypothetical protein [Gemmatimonadota bacterium]
MTVPWHAGCIRTWTRLATLLVGVLVLTAAQSSQNPTADPDPPARTQASTGLRIYVGMWSTHVRDLNRGLSNNWLVGVGWRGVYGGTFVNSFGNRSFTAGIQRTVARGQEDAVVPFFQYRVGVVSGYDERFISIASWLPVLPLGQLLGGLETGRAGVELGWAGLVATLGPHFRF